MRFRLLRLAGELVALGIGYFLRFRQFGLFLHDLRSRLSGLIPLTGNQAARSLPAFTDYNQNKQAVALVGGLVAERQVFAKTRQVRLGDKGCLT